MDILDKAIAKREIFNERQNKGNITKPCHIAFGVDANFVRPMGITITSLLINNRDEDFVFHIFLNSIHDIDVERLRMLAKQYETTIQLYFIDKSVFGELPTTWRCSHAVYNRFVVGRALYGVSDRVLYLDADIVCLGKVRELLDTNLGSSVAAVVQEEKTEFINGQIKKLQLQNGKYFNAGVLYIDVVKWNEQNISDKAVQLLAEKYEFFNLMDQDALNVLLDGKVKFVNSKWDFMCNLEKKIKEIPADTVLLHYTSREKPWHKWCIHPLAATFTQYAAQSLWRDVPLDEIPRSYKEMKMMGRALLHQKDYSGSLYWYSRYVQEKLKIKLTGKKEIQ